MADDSEHGLGMEIGVSGWLVAAFMLGMTAWSLLAAVFPRLLP